MATKEQVSATAVPVEEDPVASEEATIKPERRVKRAIWTIVAGVALPCIPIIVITAVLLWFIFHYRLDLATGLGEFAPAPKEVNRSATEWLDYIRHNGGDQAYYVDYNPSTITTIASWTSRVIPYLASSIMALVAFFAARHIVLKSKHGDEHGTHLPTPEQLSLLINMLNGSGFSPLKDTLLHRYRKKEKLISPLPAAFTALFFITSLGLLIPLVDTWFGVAVKAVTIQQIFPTQANLKSLGRSFNYTEYPSGPRDDDSAFGINPNKVWWPSNLQTLTKHGAYYLTMYDALQVVYGTSRDHKVYNYTDASNIEYLYLGDNNHDSTVDYQAKTYGVSAQCVPMTQLCYSNFNNSGVLFNCTTAFSGNVHQNFLNSSAAVEDNNSDTLNSGDPVGVAFAGNPELTIAGEQIWMPPAGWNAGDPQTGGTTVPKMYPTNPLYYGAWAYGYPSNNGGSDLGPEWENDTGISQDSGLYGGAVWMLNCSTTVWDIQYSWVNGTVKSFNKTMSSTDMAGMFSGPPAQYGAPLMSAVITEAARVAAYQGKSSRIIANGFAREFSRRMLSLASTSLQPQVNELEQIRQPHKIVARIPLAPLYLLLATKALYVLSVIILAIGAYCFTHPAETEVVKAQLSVKGLTEAHFNAPGMVRKDVVKQLQDRLDVANGKGPAANSEAIESEKEPASTTLRHAATEPIQGSAKVAEAGAAAPRVGLMPTPEGSWEFVVVANGVWASIKPLVKTFVLQEAGQGELGTAGKVLKAWN